MKHLMPVLEGGYPFDDVSIAQLQAMFNERDSFIYTAYGDKAIVSGMELDVNNNIVSDGLMTYNGKLYHFVGGAKQTQITLKETVTQRQFEDNNLKDAFKNEFFEFGADGSVSINFSDLKRFYRNQPILKEVKYVGASITNTDLVGTGWFIADGSNGTDDLRGQFIVGKKETDSKFNYVGKKSGSTHKTIAASNLPAVSSDVYIGEEGTGWPDGSSGTTGVGAAHSYARKTKKLNLSEFGATNTPMDIMPPYYVMVIIQFIG